MNAGTRARGRRRRGAGQRRWLWRALGLVGLGLLALLVLVGGLWFWSRRAGPLGEPFEVEIERALDADALCAELVRLELIRDPRLFTLYVRLFRVAPDVQAGTHLLRKGLSPAALIGRLTRSFWRPKVKVTIPEGFNQFQIAQRLLERDIAPRTQFLRASVDPSLLAELGIPGRSAEGYLFPATYDLPVDSDSAVLVRLLGRETLRRFHAVADRHPEEIRARQATDGWGMHELITLASIVEKEAGGRDEDGKIASVFYNRLHDPTFRPKQMLQSDPTAAYGCLVLGDRVETCRGYTGSVTPAMLRDVSNDYNTYKHPGLPPGPICNPSQAALEAVVAPAETPFFFFVAGPGKRHVFSRTFSEHERAIGVGAAAAAASAIVPGTSGVDSKRAESRETGSREAESKGIGARGTGPQEAEGGLEITPGSTR
jgi:UPF0755 protein